jgi:hypothetical protein
MADATHKKRQVIALTGGDSPSAGAGGLERRSMINAGAIWQDLSDTRHLSQPPGG